MNQMAPLMGHSTGLGLDLSGNFAGVTAPPGSALFVLESVKKCCE